MVCGVEAVNIIKGGLIMSEINRINFNGTNYTIGGSGDGGLTESAKQALLACFAHVVWVDADGQDYYDALEETLYPPKTLVSISCVYTQSGTVYATDSLDSLKDDLVVTALYDDTSTGTITAYVLSGTLTVGTSIITVSYGGKETTFSVTVSESTTHTITTENTENPAFTFVQTQSVITMFSDEGQTEISEQSGGRSAMYQSDPVSADVTMTVTIYNPIKGYVKQILGSYDLSNSTVYNAVVADATPNAAETKTFTVNVNSGERLGIFNLYNWNPYGSGDKYVVTATWEE